MRAATRPSSDVNSSIKALEAVDSEHLLVLEKVRQPQSHLTVLREIPFAQCPPADPCDAAAALVRGVQIHESDNFEGLACLFDDPCLLVSDDADEPGRRSALALVRLRRL